MVALRRGCRPLRGGAFRRRRGVAPDTPNEQGPEACQHTRGRRQPRDFGAYHAAHNAKPLRFAHDGGDDGVVQARSDGRHNFLSGRAGASEGWKRLCGVARRDFRVSRVRVAHKAFGFGSRAAHGHDARGRRKRRGDVFCVPVRHRPKHCLLAPREFFARDMRKLRASVHWDSVHGLGVLIRRPLHDSRRLPSGSTIRR